MDSNDENSPVAVTDINLDDVDLTKFGIEDPQSIDPHDIDLTKIDLSKVDLSQFGNLSEYVDISKIDINKLNLSQFGINDVHHADIANLNQITGMSLDEINVNELGINNAIKLTGINFYGINLDSFDKSKIDLGELIRNYNHYTNNPKKFMSNATKQLLYLAIAFGFGFIVQLISLIVLFCNHPLAFSFLYFISTLFMMFSSLFICSFKKFCSSIFLIPHIVSSVIIAFTFVFSTVFSFSVIRGIVILFWLIQLFDMIVFYLTLFYLTWEITKRLCSRLISKYITKSSNNQDLHENLISSQNRYHDAENNSDAENPIDVIKARYETEPTKEHQIEEKPLVNIPETEEVQQENEQVEENVNDDSNEPSDDLDQFEI